MTKRLKGVLAGACLREEACNDSTPKEPLEHEPDGALWQVVLTHGPALARTLGRAWLLHPFCNLPLIPA